MNILSISKLDKCVVVKLSADELVTLTNAMYGANDEHKNPIFHRLNSDLMIARELSQYGHIDQLSMNSIISERIKECDAADVKRVNKNNEDKGQQ